MAERNLNTALKKRLINNEPFVYAHLIKYERPHKAHTNGKHSTDASIYAYLADGSVNIDFNDGSLASDGTTANGTQTYVADKIAKIGSYSETVEAKATGMTLTLSAESLYNSITASTITMTSSTITVPSSIDLVAEGFREGDKISITGGTNNGHEVRITGIKTNNTVLTVSNIDSTLATQNTGTSITIQIISDEIKGPLIELNDSTLKSYHNRDVFVYKAFLDPDTYAIIGAPTLVFKGIIASASLQDNPNKNLTVNWKLTSHWGDFAQVNGRPTSDSIHRAVDENGIGQPDVALKDIYASDLGFEHADVTLSTMSTYKYMEKVPELVSKKKGIFGLRRKYSQIWVDEERTAQVDLNWALSSKYLPVVYGVDLVEGIPIFVDTENNNMSAVYIAYAICEGEIGGIYDFYFDDHPRVCLNVEDFDARRDGGTEEGAEVTCIGRADKGTVLGGKALVDIDQDAATLTETLDSINVGTGGGGKVGGKGVGATKRIAHYYNTNQAYLTQTGMDATADAGILHEQTHEVQTPNEMFLTLHSGLTHQRADDTLSTIANGTDKFKRQTDYYNGPDYWGPNHILSDTAYVVVKCIIGEDDESVPETKYVVRGKLIDCHNYDFSYRRDGATFSPADVANNFKIGDTVGLRNTTGNAYLKKTDNSDQDDLVIIDKWDIVTNLGEIETRFRFSDAPGLNYVNGIPTITSFYMEDDTGGTTLKYHFVSSNHIADSGTVPSALASEGTTSISNNKPIITFSGTAPTWIYDSGTELFPKVNDVEDELVPIAFLEGYAYDGNSYMTQHNDSNGNVLTLLGTSTNNYIAASNVNVIRTDAIQLATSALTDNDAYNGMRIELTIRDADGDYTVQKREIVDYDGSLRIAQINIPWDKDSFPKDTRSAYANYTYTYKILAPKDTRVSTNPAIQLLDYSTSETYGKRLDLDLDIELGSWLSAARTCDSRGTQKCHGINLAAAVNDRYVLTHNGAYNGNIIAMGKVKTAVVAPGGGTANSIEFEEVYGKFTKTFMADRHTYAEGDIIANFGGYYRVGTAGTQPAKTASVSSTTSNATGVTIDVGGSISVGQVVFGIGIKEHVTVSAISGTSVTLSSAQSLVAGTKLYFCSNLTRLTSFDIHKLGATDNGTAIALTKTTEGAYDDTTEYSLYNSDFIRYWRQLGWESHHQRWATRHQTCTTLDTSNSVFNNMNGMLQQFNGILSFEAGKYALRIEVESDNTEQTSNIATSSDTGYTVGTELNPRYITDDNIIGTIKVTDPGPKKSFNTVSSTIADPGSKFEGKQVSFYNSNFLKADKNIKKSGNFAQTSVHNYYNARINVENYLKESRYQTKINFSLGPRGLLLVSGDVISLTHSKFGWNQKQFRIENLNFKTNCTVDVSASEYDASFYSITTPTLESNQIPSSRTPVPYSLSTPNTFSVAAGAAGQIDLVWKNAANLPSNSVTEIWYAAGDTSDTSIRKYLGSVTAAPKVVNQVNGAVSGTTVAMDSVTGLVTGMVLRGTTALNTASTGNSPITISSISGNNLTISASQTIPDNTRLTFLSPGEYTHYIGLDGSDKTYWLRHCYTELKSGKTYKSDFTTRQAITTVYPATLYQVTLNSDAQIFSGNSSSVIQSPDHIKFTAAKTNLSGAFVWSTDHSVDLYAATSGGSPTTSGTSVYLRKADMASNDDVVVTVTVTSTSAERTAGAEDTYTESITIPRIDAGGGAGAKTVRIRSTGLVFLDDNDDTSTTPDSPAFIKLEAVKQNTSATANWAVTDDSPSVSLRSGTSASSGVVTTGDAVYLHKADYAGNTSVLVTLTCDSIVDTTSIVRLSRNSGIVQAVLTNPAHVLPADSDGAVSNTQAAGSGTDIRVFEGATALTFVPDGTGAGEWDVSVGNTADIVEGADSDQGTYARIADHTSVTTGTDKYTITYTISGKKLDGTAFTNFTVDQNLTKAKAGTAGAAGDDAKSVSLTIDDYSIIYNAAGSSPSPSGNMTLTATSQNFTDGYFKFTGDGITDETSYTNGSGANADTFTFAIPSSHFTTPKSLRVGVAEAAADSTEIAFDTITINAVKPGSDGDAAHTGFLTNSAHVVSTATDGTGYSYTGAGGTFERYDGGTDKTGSDTTYYVGASGTSLTETKNGLTMTITQATGVYALSGGSWTSDSETFTLRAIFDGVTVTSVYTISKSKKGTTGDEGDAGLKVAEIEIYYPITSWSGTESFPNSAPSTGTYNFSSGVVASLQSGWTQTKPAIDTGTTVSTSTALATESSSGSGVSSSITWSVPSLTSSGVQFTNFIFKYQTSAGSAPAATDYPAIPSGWTDGIPSNPNDGKKLFSCRGVAKLAGSFPNFTFQYTWQTPVVHTQTKADVGLGSAEDKSSADIRGEIDSGDLAGSGKAFATLPASGATVGAVFGTNLFKTGTTNFTAAELKNDQIALAISGTGLSLTNAGSGVTLAKANVGLNNVDNTSDATTLGGNLTGTVDGTAVATVKSGAARGQAGLAANGDVNRAVPQGQGGTGLTSNSTILNTNTTKANVGLSNVPDVDMRNMDNATSGTLPTARTAATDNGTTINTSGNISGTVDIASGGSITVGNITIDGSNNRILITD